MPDRSALLTATEHAAPRCGRGAGRRAARHALAVVGAVLVAFSLSGCGGGDGGSASSSPAETTPAEETVTTDAPAPTPDPMTLVPGLSDVPSGYAVSEEGTGPIGLEAALRERTAEEAALIEEGRVSGYEVTFVHPERPALNCTATVYRSDEAAGEVFTVGNEQAPETARTGGGTLEPAGVDEPIGEETAAFDVEYGGVTGFVVTWRHRNLLGLCAAAGSGSVDPADALQAAAAEQARFADAVP